MTIETYVIGEYPNDRMVHVFSEPFEAVLDFDANGVDDPSVEPPAYENPDDRVREIVREEIASLAGLVLRRSQDIEARMTRSPDRNMATEAVAVALQEIFGEALTDFSGPSAPGS